MCLIIPSKIANSKYLGIYLTKDMQEFYMEHYKTLLKSGVFIIFINQKTYQYKGVSYPQTDQCNSNQNLKNFFV